MTKKELQLVQTMVVRAVNDAVPPAIQTTVNGKIDKLSTKVDVHIEEHRRISSEVNFTVGKISGDVWWLMRLSGAVGVAVVGGVALAIAEKII